MHLLIRSMSATYDTANGADCITHRDVIVVVADQIFQLLCSPVSREELLLEPPEPYRWRHGFPVIAYAIIQSVYLFLTYSANLET